MRASVKVSAAVLAAGLTLGMASTAQAVTYNITSDHSSSNSVTGGSLPNNGITISVTQDAVLANTVDFSFTFASGWGIISNGQDAASFVFVLPNSSATISALTSGFSTVGPVSAVPGIALNGNIQVGSSSSSVGYGVLGGTPANPATALSFKVTDASGLTTSSFLSGGYSCSGGPSCPTQTPVSGVFFADVRNAQGQTGIVDFGVSQVPLPPAAMLFGSGLLGLGLLGRRRKAKAASLAAA